MTDHPFTPLPDKPTKCRWCMLAEKAHPCPECEGTGRVVASTSLTPITATCPVCKGEGKA